MQNEHDMHAYIRPGKGTLIVIIILIAIIIASVFAGVAAKKKGEAAVPELFIPIHMDTGTYAYVDVIAVSDWLYKVDEATYYAVLDEEMYGYTVRLTSAQFKELAPQFEYWNDTDENAVPPAPVRLYGMVQSVNNETAEAIASIFELAGADEYYETFGDLMLNTTTSPAEEGSALWILLALFSFIMLLCVGLPYYSIANHAKKSLARLEELGVTGIAADEFASPETQSLNKDSVRLGREFIFSKRLGVAVKYTDIEWVYRKVTRYYFIAVAETLVGYAAGHKGAISFMGKGARTKKGETSPLETVATMIANANPNVRIGYSAENIKAHRDAIKAAKAAL